MLNDEIEKHIYTKWSKKKKRIAIKWTRMNIEEKKQMRGWIISYWRVELRRKTKFTK
jgi:hypothetical protein